MKLKYEIFLTILFIALKLDGIIPFTWTQALCPILLALLGEIITPIVVSIIFREPKAKYKSYAYGRPLFWDAKTQTMYGDHIEDDVKET